MCAVDSYDREHILGPEYGSIGGGRPLPIVSSKESFESVGRTIDSIDNWIQLFKGIYDENIYTNKR